MFSITILHTLLILNSPARQHSSTSWPRPVPFLFSDNLWCKKHAEPSITSTPFLKTLKIFCVYTVQSSSPAFFSPWTHAFILKMYGVFQKKKINKTYGVLLMKTRTHTSYQHKQARYERKEIKAPIFTTLRKQTEGELPGTRNTSFHKHKKFIDDITAYSNKLKAK